MPQPCVGAIVVTVTIAIAMPIIVAKWLVSSSRCPVARRASVTVMALVPAAPLAGDVPPQGAAVPPQGDGDEVVVLTLPRALVDLDVVQRSTHTQPMIDAGVQAVTSIASTPSERGQAAFRMAVVNPNLWVVVHKRIMADKKMEKKEANRKRKQSEKELAQREVHVACPASRILKIGAVFTSQNMCSTKHFSAYFWHPMFETHLLLDHGIAVHCCHLSLIQQIRSSDCNKHAESMRSMDHVLIALV